MIVENYPQLKSNENFLRLQDELAGTENRIAVERKRYNDTLQDYNTYVQQFPNNIFAGWRDSSRMMLTSRPLKDRVSCPRSTSPAQAHLHRSRVHNLHPHTSSKFQKRRSRLRLGGFLIFGRLILFVFRFKLWLVPFRIMKAPIPPSTPSAMNV